MSSLLHQIVRLCKATWDPHNAAGLATNVEQLKRLVDRLTARDLNLPPGLLADPHQYARQQRRLLSPSNPAQSESPDPAAPCTYVSLLHHPDVTINVFILAAGTEMPLHDHPCMHGLLKPIAGQLAVQCYTAIDESGEPTTVLPEQMPTCIAVRREPAVQVDATSEAVLLTPQLGNFHHIRPLAGEAAAFLDILSPPYHTLVEEFGTRDCTYYQPLDVGAPGAEVCVLMPTPSPPDFWCYTVPYTLGDDDDVETQTEPNAAP